MEWFGVCAPKKDSGVTDLCGCVREPQTIQQPVKAPLNGSKLGSKSPNGTGNGFAGKLAPKPAIPMAGIGAAFESSDGVGLFVHSFVPGGPAECCRLVKKGDELISVDGIDVRGMKARELAQILIGPVGTQVRVGFARQKEGTPEVEEIIVELTRQQSSSSKQGP